MESLFKKKNEEKNLNYTFAEDVFHRDVTGPGLSRNSFEISWSHVYGNIFDPNEISITDEERRNNIFYKTRVWKERLKKEIKEYYLPKFKYNDPENEQRLKDVIVVSKDLINAL